MTWLFTIQTSAESVPSLALEPDEDQKRTQGHAELEKRAAQGWRKARGHRDLLQRQGEGAVGAVRVGDCQVRWSEPKRSLQNPMCWQEHELCCKTTGLEPDVIVVYYWLILSRSPHHLDLWFHLSKRNCLHHKVLVRIRWNKTDQVILRVNTVLYFSQTQVGIQPCLFLTVGP